ncbi:CHRD domain-containing protein [Gilvimarinus algae]|uniref:CHRD domain-containing protein n=1 Tax=Gilvimarinus algae TaxID=3058037 RepID=A0ABT8T9I6_9GAMM|nr:CHRD domain-containing protein [Gilvimarinus sp. SDUM040014]MDO3380601.1 CHRD domain-containing protein [Gilvimarinus sp. SDUM040014]
MRIPTLAPRQALKHFLIVATAFGVSACGSDNDDTPLPDPEPTPEILSYDVMLEGNQEVPMVETEQSAMASVTVNETDMMVMAEMDLSEVDGVTSAHIHSGEVGTNGPVAFGFSDADENGVWEIENESITSEQHEGLLSGQWYINVHTDSFPDGELRGQLLTDTQSVHVFTLSGKQEVPGVETDAHGQGYLLHDSDDDALTLNVWTWDLTATAAHIHHAEAGINGDVVVGLEASTDTEGLWQLPSDAVLGSDAITALGMANLYVNVHTDAHPEGEIRGQILPANYSLVLFDLSPGQEVPRIDSEATGLGYATLNTGSGGLRLNAWAMNMETSAAHIHQAPIGENGDVAIGLEESMDHDGLWQTPENTALDADTQTLLLSGGHYVNMHSESFPNGEIRGQITPAPWDVLAFSLSGSQEVPALDTQAEGDGYAMVNTVAGDIMLVVHTRNLDTASAAHIHAGIAGSNGDVVVGLEQDEGSVSTWRLPADTSLDMETLAQLLDAGHYVNVHSPENPGGEIRGQILTPMHVMFPLMLSGDLEVPMVETSASGQGAFTLNTHTESLRGAFTTSGLTSTAAHIHQAPAGENGDVVLALDATDEGYMVPADTMLTDELEAIMLDGGHYVNVHSAAFPNGEIRDQIDL